MLASLNSESIGLAIEVLKIKYKPMQSTRIMAEYNLANSLAEQCHAKMLKLNNGEPMDGDQTEAIACKFKTILDGLNGNK